MLSDKLLSNDKLLPQGEHVMRVCNACRYCEQYCPVFPAMEQRLIFREPDLNYLANLCHNCGECLYACQYAPPHEFGINVPRTLSEIRQRSYESYCWPGALGAAFRRNSIGAGLILALVLIAILLAGTWAINPEALFQQNPRGDFYSVIPHGVLTAVFGGVSLFVMAALGIALGRFSRDVRGAGPRASGSKVAARALRDALTLRHLHATGLDCTSAEETRSPWRRWFHHCTFYGFMLCFASTTVAAIYHSIFGWQAPYGYTSIPVVLGTLGGVGLLIGPAGLLALRRRRDPELSDPAQRGLDESFIALLFLASLTGLLLLMLREGPLMAALLIAHLGFVLALFLTLPYGKFVHGLYRMVALVQYAMETEGEAAGNKP